MTENIFFDLFFFFKNLPASFKWFRRARKINLVDQKKVNTSEHFSKIRRFLENPRPAPSQDTICTFFSFWKVLLPLVNCSATSITICGIVCRVSVSSLLKSFSYEPFFLFCFLFFWFFNAINGFCFILLAHLIIDVFAMVRTCYVPTADWIFNYFRVFSYIQFYSWQSP